jgi:surfeit locus 1 family protein
MDEPEGSLLRSNKPQEERWYSRDVGAIAAARGLPDVAPYFVDADATPNPGGLPVGGLTRVVFSNNHLVYAITWYCLAAMSAAMLILFWRSAAKACRGAS